MIKVLFACWLLCLAVPAHALKIAMVLWRGETGAEQGFRDELKKLGYKPEFVVFDGRQDRTLLATMLRLELLPELASYDYVYSFGTTASLMSKSLLQGRKPLIFNAVSDPFGAGILSAKKSDNAMVAGISNMVPLPLQLANARKYLPQGRVLLLPVNPREQNTRLIGERLQAAAAQYQWQVKIWRINPDKSQDSELRRFQQGAVGSVVFLPADSYLISMGPQLLRLLNEARIPTICSTEAFIPYGCTVGTVSNYHAQGELAAGILDRHQKGVSMADMPLQFDLSPRLVVGKQ